MAKTLKISDYMAKKVITLMKDKTVKDAAQIMKKYNISTIIVVEKEKPVGIITERDIINKVVSAGKSLTTKVQVVMSKKFITANDTITDIEAATIMTKNKIKKLPILHNGKLVGVITETDLLKILGKKWAL